MNKKAVIGVILCAAMTLTGIGANVPEKVKAEENTDTSKGVIIYPEEIETDTEDPFNDGYIPMDDNAVEDGAISETEENYGYPASYDARNDGIVTGVKYQGMYSTCWAFAALSAAETSMLKQGYADYNVKKNTPDYSEYHLAYFEYHSNASLDPIGGLEGDVNGVGTYERNYLTNGGSNISTILALSTWMGVADETTAPYGSATQSSSLPGNIEYTKNVAHLQNARMVSASSVSGIKKFITQYGSAVAGMYYSTMYFNKDYSAYYCYGSSTANHSVALIGWDDNYDFSEFTHKPEGKGAWLVKNSNGTGEIFYISYYDKVLCNQRAYAYQYEPADNYDFNYQYDGGFSTVVYNMANGNSLSNVFEVKGSSVEALDAVSIALADDNIAYSVQVYANPPKDKPTKGTPMLAQPVKGKTAEPGLYTIPLSEKLYLEKGETFAVVVTYEDTDAGDDTVRLYMDGDYQSANYSFNSHTEPGQSYLIEDGVTSDIYSHNFGVASDDKVTTGGAIGFCPRIKAFTEDASGSITPIDLSAAKVKLSKTVWNYVGKPVTPKATVTLDGKVIPSYYYTITYKNNDKPGIAVAEISGRALYSGRVNAAFTINPTTAMYRLYNPNSGEHFYTADEKEKDNVVAAGWQYEGVAWYAPKTSDLPVYRVYNPNAGDHHYSLSKKECDDLVKLGWKYEGIVWYSDEAEGTVLYRLYNPNCTGAGAHHYTVSAKEKDDLISIGWKDEGTAWYGLK